MPVCFILLTHYCLFSLQTMASNGPWQIEASVVQTESINMCEMLCKKWIIIYVQILPLIITIIIFIIIETLCSALTAWWRLTFLWLLYNLISRKHMQTCKTSRLSDSELFLSVSSSKDKLPTCGESFNKAVIIHCFDTSLETQMNRCAKQSATSSGASWSFRWLYSPSVC